jgi:hypothetical protein
MSEFYLKVVDHPELVRDRNSKAILNTDLGALNKYKEEREFRMKLEKIVKENDQLKNDVSEIKNLLLKVLEQR